MMNNLPTNRTLMAGFLQKSLGFLSSRYPHFNASGGRDHAWVFTQGLGGRMFGDFRSIGKYVAASDYLFVGFLRQAARFS